MKDPKLSFEVKIEIIYLFNTVLVNCIFAKYTEGKQLGTFIISKS